MKKNDNTIRLAAWKPRNPIAVWLRFRRGDEHAPSKRERNGLGKDLVQRLREAGL